MFFSYRRGTAQPQAKLTERSAAQLIHAYLDGVPRQRIAEVFQVSNSRVSRIGKGHAWRYVYDRVLAERAAAFPPTI